MKYTAALYTDQGPRKESNQDSACLRRAAWGDGEILLAAVCDGMGGLQKGELASAEAVRTLCSWFDSNLGLLPELCQGDFSRVRAQWSDLLQETHRSLLAYSAGSGIQLGTTFTALLAFENRYLTANVGDSRIYRRTQEGLVQMTADQSLMAREIALGRITEEEARHHPQRNVLLQCLGAGAVMQPDFGEGRLRGDGLYLLCSDGMVHELSPGELEAVLAPAFLTTPEDLARGLAEITNRCIARGEADNITGILIRARESDCPAPKRRGLGALLRRREPEPERAVTLLEARQLLHTQETLGRS